MVKQTAVQWYAEQEIQLTLDFLANKISEPEYGFCRLKLFEQAKEMFEQQIIDAYDEGVYLAMTPSKTADDYYEEKFKSKKKK
jgi:hypothetical protein